MFHRSVSAEETIVTLMPSPSSTPSQRTLSALQKSWFFYKSVEGCGKFDSYFAVPESLMPSVETYVPLHGGYEMNTQVLSLMGRLLLQSRGREGESGICSHWAMS